MKRQFNVRFDESVFTEIEKIRVLYGLKSERAAVELAVSVIANLNNPDVLIPAPRSTPKTRVVSETVPNNIGILQVLKPKEADVRKALDLGFIPSESEPKELAIEYDEPI